jgi:glycosyltransferase involved in cell wall biosynthesis
VSPQVTVVIPVRDGARFIREAVESTATQGLELEVVVVDDGSTDDSARIAGEVGVVCIRQPNAGPAAARNTGLAASSAPFVTFLDVDDLIPEGTVARQVAHLEAHPDHDGVMGLQDYRILDGVARPDWAVADKVGEADQVVRPHVFASVIRRSTFDRVGLFNPGLRYSEDVDWLMRARERGAVIEVEDEVARIRRIHGANLTYDTEALRRSQLEILADRARRKRSAT